MWLKIIAHLALNKSLTHSNFHPSEFSNICIFFLTFLLGCCSTTDPQKSVLCWKTAKIGIKHQSINLLGTSFQCLFVFRYFMHKKAWKQKITCLPTYQHFSNHVSWNNKPTISYGWPSCVTKQQTNYFIRMA
jgi:hypothetical protein